MGRGHLRHKVWIRLHHWPLDCWNRDDVLAAVSSFGALWETDDACNMLREVSFYRANIRCNNFRDIPTSLLLRIDDRRFTILIEIESWEKANPILLDEVMDRRLGLDTVEDQNAFIRSTGFRAFPVTPDTGGSTSQPRGHHREALSEGTQRRSLLGGPPVQAAPSHPTGFTQQSVVGVLTPPVDPCNAAAPMQPRSPSEVSNSNVCGCQVVRFARSGPLTSTAAVDPPPLDLDCHSLDLGPLGSLEWSQGQAPLQPVATSPTASTLGSLERDHGQVYLQPDPPASTSGPSPLRHSSLGLLHPTASTPVTVPLDACSRLSARRSLRLASKYKGNSLPSLQRAQVLRCKRMKVSLAQRRVTVPPPSSPPTNRASSSFRPPPPRAALACLSSGQSSQGPGHCAPSDGGGARKNQGSMWHPQHGGRAPSGST